MIAKTTFNDHANDTDFEQLGIGDCAPLPIEMPKQWEELSIQVSVSLILTGSNCVSREFFESFAVTSVREAVKSLVTMKDENLVYTFSAVNAIPFFAFDADWPLLRHSSQNCSVAPRVKVQGAEPWAWHQDRTLFEIYRKPFSDNAINSCTDFGGRPGGRLYLRVGGLSKDQAASDWMLCAKVLRVLCRDARKLLSREEQPSVQTLVTPKNAPTGTTICPCCAKHFEPAEVIKYTGFGMRCPHCNQSIVF